MRTFFQVKNTGTEKLEFVVRRGGLQDLITVSNRVFSLDPGQSQVVEIIVTLPKELGVYTTKLILEAGGIKKELPLIITADSGEKLFDVILDIPSRYKEAEAGGIVSTKTTIFNLGASTAVDVVVNYVIKDFDDHIILQTSETVAVETRATIVKDILLPRNLKPGRYLLITEVRYKETVSVSSDTFVVVEGKERSETIIYLSFIITFIALFALAFEWSRHHVSKSSKQMEEIKTILERGRKALQENEMDGVYQAYLDASTAYKKLSSKQERKILRSKILALYADIIKKVT